MASYLKNYIIHCIKTVDEGIYTLDGIRPSMEEVSSELDLPKEKLFNILSRYLRIRDRHDHPTDECDHDDVDDCQCLNCGADLTEEMSARAYDRAKDSWKYGD